MACTFPTTTESPSAWLDAINLAKYKPHFEKAGLTEVPQLFALTDEQLSAAGIGMVGHRKRLLLAAKELTPAESPMEPPAEESMPMELEPRIGAMELDDPEDAPLARPRDRSLSFGMPAGATLPSKKAADAGSSDAHPADDSNNPTPKADYNQRRANSTSSIYISSTLTKPDTEEIVFCIAIVVHERIQQGEAQPHEVRHRYPYFSEDNNPLYAVPAESDGRGSDSSDGGSDSEKKRTRRETPTEDTIFHTIRSVFECAQIPAECLIVSLVYMERLIATTGCPILVTSWRPILLASLILAQKVWDDRSLHNADFSVFCPMFTLKEINFLEKKFLELVDYDVSITASLYASYYFQLRTLCQRVDREFNLKPMDVETAAKLEARGSSHTAKLKEAAPRKNQSANAISAVPGGGGSSAFLSKLFN